MSTTATPTPITTATPTTSTTYSTWEAFNKAMCEGKAPAELRSDPQLNVKSFTVKHITSKVANAGSNAFFDLRVKPSMGDAFMIKFPDTPTDQRKAGETREYTLEVDRPLNVFDFVQAESTAEKAGSLHMRVRDKDSDRDRNAWLPSHIQVTANLANGNAITFADREWPESKWFSGNEKDAGGLAKPSWNLVAV